LEKKDGEIDYSLCSLQELLDVESHIDADSNPKNHANLRVAIDRALAEQRSKADTKPVLTDGKSLEQIRSEIGVIDQKRKIVTVVFLILWLPVLVARYVDPDSLFSIGRTAWYLLSGAVLILLLWEITFLNKCPNCTNYPGSDWRRKNCKSCGIELRE